jgi:hypothetical protein
VQLSNIFRRGIVRPLDEHAERQLANFWIDSPIRVEWLPIFSDSIFEKIWESKIFQDINSVCKTGISDYEEVQLEVDKIVIALRVIREARFKDDQVVMFCKKLDGLLSDALISKKTVYFIL